MGRDEDGDVPVVVDVLCEVSDRGHGSGGQSDDKLYV